MEKPALVPSQVTCAATRRPSATTTALARAACVAPMTLSPSASLTGASAWSDLEACAAPAATSVTTACVLPRTGTTALPMIGPARLPIHAALLDTCVSPVASATHPPTTTRRRSHALTQAPVSWTASPTAPTASAATLPPRRPARQAASPATSRDQICAARAAARASAMTLTSSSSARRSRWKKPDRRQHEMCKGGMLVYSQRRAEKPYPYLIH